MKKFKAVIEWENKTMMCESSGKWKNKIKRISGFVSKYYLQ